MGLTGSVRVRTFQDRRWRMTLWEGQNFGELYDLDNDPGEIVNLWKAPGTGPCAWTLWSALEALRIAGPVAAPDGEA